MSTPSRSVEEGERGRETTTKGTEAFHVYAAMERDTRFLNLQKGKGEVYVAECTVRVVSESLSFLPCLSLSLSLFLYHSALLVVKKLWVSTLLRFRSSFGCMWRVHRARQLICVYVVSSSVRFTLRYVTTDAFLFSLFSVLSFFFQIRFSLRFLLIRRTVSFF